MLVLIVYHLCPTLKTWARDPLKYFPSRVDGTSICYNENEILMTQCRLREFSILTISNRSKTNRSSVVSVLGSYNVMMDQIFSHCTVVQETFWLRIQFSNSHVFTIERGVLYV